MPVLGENLTQINRTNQYNLEELIKVFTDKEKTPGIQPAEVEAIKRNFLTFKSPNVNNFVAVVSEFFDPAQIQIMYIMTTVYGDSWGLKNVIKTLANKARSIAVGTFNSDLTDPKRKSLAKEVIDEIDYLLPILNKAVQDATKRPTYISLLISRNKQQRLEVARTHALDAARDGKPMDPAFVNLAGTEYDDVAKMYVKTYVEARPNTPTAGRKGLKKTRKNKKDSKKSRKQRK